MTRSRIAPLLAVLCLVALVATPVDRRLLGLPFVDRAPIGDYFARSPDLMAEGYTEFLQGVRQRTRNGDSIAILVPARQWNEGYSYAYYRASYFLAGRQVIPLVQPDDRAAPQNLKLAKYLAVWGGDIPLRSHAIVWRGSGGALMRR